MKKFVCVAGLPRSGSTLLVNLLNQNPRFACGSSSPVLEVLKGAAATFDQLDFAKAMPVDRRTDLRVALVRGALQGVSDLVDGEVVFDKNRGWPGSFELLETLLGGRENVYCIACVRDLKDVIASFEKLHRETAKTGMTSQAATRPLRTISALERAKLMMESSQPIGASIMILMDATTRGWRDRMIFISYEGLTAHPKGAIDYIYQFIGEEPFAHDFDHVEMTTPEDDSVHGFVGLHDIRPKIETQDKQWDKVFDRSVTSTPFWAEVERMSFFWM